MSHHASRLLPVGASVGASGQFVLARFVRAGLRSFAVLLLAGGLTTTAAPVLTESQLKATFVFNFVKFTEWPANAFTNATAPIVIGVAGEDSFRRTLEDLVEGEVVSGRRLVVKRVDSSEEFSAYHVLFLSRIAKDRLLVLLAALKNKPVLTISDLDRFCEQGGMINLVLLASGTVQPQVNCAAANLAGVQISSRLLNLPSVRLVATERQPR